MPSRKRTKVNAAEPKPVNLGTVRDIVNTSQKIELLQKTRSRTRAFREATEVQSPGGKAAPKPIRPATESQKSKAAIAGKGTPVLELQAPSQKTESQRRAASRRSVRPSLQSSNKKDQSTQTDLPEKPSGLQFSDKKDQSTQTILVEQPSELSPRARLFPDPNNQSQVRSWVERVTIESESQISTTEESEAVSESSSCYRRWGYDPPEKEDMASTNDETSQLPSDRASKTSGRKRNDTIGSTRPGFYNGLLERGILFRPIADPHKKELAKAILRKNTYVTTPEEEENWRIDVEKCTLSDEALFQRTVMMDVMDRHRLNPALDYTCETRWTCNRMPHPPEGDASKMSKPKPDLAVAFNFESVADLRYLPKLKDWKGYMCPEASKENKDNRAFHFFSMEVKGAQFAVGDNVGHRQNHNTATQALHNMYMFMKRANAVETFLNKVRFYSAMGTSSGFHIRVHRAVLVDQKFRIRPDYPLGFGFDEIYRTKNDFTRAEISSVVKNILVEYGVKVLLPILKNAVTAVMEDFEKESLSYGAEKRPADSVLESFGSQRARVGDLHLSGGTESPNSQLVGAQVTVGAV